MSRIIQNWLTWVCRPNSCVSLVGKYAFIPSRVGVSNHLVFRTYWWCPIHCNSLVFTWVDIIILSNVPTWPSDLSCALQEQQQSSVYFALCSWLVKEICLKGRDYNSYERENSESVGTCWSTSDSTANVMNVMSVMQLTEKYWEDKSNTQPRHASKMCHLCQACWCRCCLWGWMLHLQRNTNEAGAEGITFFGEIHLRWFGHLGLT